MTIRYDWRALLVVGALVGLCNWARAQELVHFPSLDRSFLGFGEPIELDGYLYRANGPGRHPAVVFLHGCGGLLSPSSHQISSREADWAHRLVALGYVGLGVGSFTPRLQGIECGVGGPVRAQLERPRDAYGALR